MAKLPDLTWLQIGRIDLGSQSVKFDNAFFNSKRSSIARENGKAVSAETATSAISYRNMIKKDLKFEAENRRWVVTCQ
jgi:hypothetical protein